MQGNYMAAVKGAEEKLEWQQQRMGQNLLAGMVIPAHPGKFYGTPMCFPSCLNFWLRSNLLLSPQLLLLSPAPLLCPWDLCARADVLQRRDRKVLLLSRFLMDFHRWVKIQRDSHLSAYQTCILSAQYPQHCH